LSHQQLSGVSMVGGGLASVLCLRAHVPKHTLFDAQNA
jgi:hypothetical protein